MGARMGWLAALFLVACAPPLRAGAPVDEPPAPRTEQARCMLPEMGSMQPLPARQGEPDRVALGDALGLLHVYEKRDAGYEEVWRSTYLEGSVCALYVGDVDMDERDEIVAFTDRGRIHYFDMSDYHTLWSSAPTAYTRFTAVAVANIDDDPQPEFIVCTSGRLVVYDGREQYEQWRSDQTGLGTTDILVANVDGDDDAEIILNDGYVFNARYRNLEWQSPQTFGERMGVLDVDGDGILELIGEYSGRFLRVFDVDLRREKSLER